MSNKRKLDLVVISDVHLGTYGCRAKELLDYLRSIETERLILNGDFIDIWQFKKKYFPKEHMQVLHKVLKMAENGTKVYYITGNHDDRLRRYADLTTGNLFLRNQLTIRLNRKKYWIFHGDVFDLSIQYSPFIAKLGGKGYDYLIVLNRLVNKLRIKLGKAEMSLASKIKDSVKQALKFVDDFEEKAINLAAEKDYDYVICGHIHRPQMRATEKGGKQIIYLNSGDWIENLTALEYKWGQWSIYRYDQSDYATTNSCEEEEPQLDDTDNISLFEQMVQLAAEV
ncbi:MAG: UDP-2,3-diacylglucosamine diphosphatase [Bacteroidota bacterium]